MTKKYFKEQTIKELKALKKHAFKKELNKLDFKTFHPDFDHRCIYGQMTGDCTSKRAIRLMNKCCKFRISSLFDPLRTVEETKYAGITWSFLERHVLRYKSFNKEIIMWLKGETKTFPIK